MDTTVMKVLPERIRRDAQSAWFMGVEEVRIRAGRPIELRGESSVLVGEPVTAAECSAMLELVCSHSVFAYEEELRGCYVALSDGSRVGLCGRAAWENGKISHLCSASGFNIRIAREVPGAADEFLRMTCENGRALPSLLISAPGAGKTTVLRDAARRLSDGGVHVCIADERNELAASANGIPTLDVGRLTDVMSGLPKSAAMRLMIRNMSPEVLITDELASGEDAEAVREAAGCGVTVMASAHAASAKELLRRRGIASAVGSGCFERMILLENRAGRRSFKDITEEVLCG